jgi:predicted short-subunit dehydrogenase-like oxidoreductase (DUF2520 family)
MKRRLEIVGAGKAGRTLARLWAGAQFLEIGAVVNRSLASAQTAVDFIGQGHAAEGVSEIDVLLIAASDRSLAPCAEQIAQSAHALPGAIAFHLSGSVSSEALASLRHIGCAVGSLHPVRSFADPARAVAEFAGSYCGVEGDAAALPFLRQAVERIGGCAFEIDRERKSIYHAGSVFASNYVAAMLHAGVNCLMQAGIAEEQARAILTQIAAGTAGNVAQLGAVNALTGPIARGEAEVVAKQFAELKQWRPELAEAYRAAGLIATEMAAQRDEAPTEALEAIRRLLQKSV